MKARDSQELNRMFRARIYAQFFTIVAVVAGGMYYQQERQQRREFERVLNVKKAQEKRDAWLRELEFRDKEERGWRERHALVDQGKNQPPPPPANPSGENLELETNNEKGEKKEKKDQKKAQKPDQKKDQKTEQRNQKKDEKKDERSDETSGEEDKTEDESSAVLEKADEKGERKSLGILDAVKNLASSKR
jgi:outer membrane biosynthesis protein TonB